MGFFVGLGKHPQVQLGGEVVASSKWCGETTWRRIPRQEGGELRSAFYLDLKRKPGERIGEFCTRYRTLVADLRAEGINLPSAELGWFLREKLGLDPLRKQLLETALAGKDGYEEVEGEVLRLFKELHVADPLHRMLWTTEMVDLH